jgi:hypothetical protein
VFLVDREITTDADLKMARSASQRALLYNPMWKMMPERSRHPRGTCVHRDDHSIVGWHCYDQIIVSTHLAERANAVRVLCKLGDAWLMTARHKDPSDTNYSDHLPVELVLPIDGVRP